MAYLGGLASVRPATPKGAVAAAIAVGAAGWYPIVHLGSGSGALGWAALGYVCLLAAMTGVALGKASREPALLTFAFGAVLFFASDLLLSMQLFRPALFARLPGAWRGDIVWLLYGTGQFLIVVTPAVASLVRGPRTYRPVPLIPLEA